LADFVREGKHGSGAARSGKDFRMDEKKFDPKKLQKLNDPDRLLDIPPEYIWNQLNLIKSDILVDIGAGTGFFSIPFAGYTKNGKVFACDVSTIMIEWMKNNICSKYPKIIPLKMEEQAVPLEDGLADLVYMINLHHELEAPKEMLKESFRLLKKNGKIFIVDWKKEDMNQGPPIHLRYLPEQVKHQLVGVGFEEVAIDNEMAKHFLVIARKG
jgi:ubiquinone/menaquinone biosynthesis C-methylase UbiE